MTITFDEVKAGYRAMWDRAEIKPEELVRAQADAAIIIKNKAVYEEISAAVNGAIPWFQTGLLHYRESSFDFGTYLGNGQPLNRVTTEVPAGRGPFASFKDGAIDALTIQGFTKERSDSVERLLYECEAFNGWGYTLHNENSPYVWSGTTLEQKGKYTSDGHYDPNLQDSQLGVAAILKALCLQDADITAFCSGVQPVGPHDPLPPQKPKPPDPAIVQQTGGHTMIDVTTIVKEVNVGLDVAEKLEPFLAAIQPQVGAAVLAALKGIRSVEASLGLTPPAPGLFSPVAAREVEDHNTPGAPNSPALSVESK